MSNITILHAMNDPELFGSAFQSWSWEPWRAFMAAAFGLGLDGEALELYRRHTGRQVPPAEPFTEAYAVVGRRGGKSRVAALIGVYLAAFRDYSRILGPGERGVVMILASDRRQARVCMGYVKGLLERPILQRMVERERRESVDLTNRITIEIHTGSFRAVRGYTIVAAILDELAYWRSDEAPTPTLRFCERSGRRWPPYPARCSSASARRMLGAACCGTPTERTTARTTPRFWSGKPTRGR